MYKLPPLEELEEEKNLEKIPFPNEWYRDDYTFLNFVRITDSGKLPFDIKLKLFEFQMNLPLEKVLSNIYRIEYMPDVWDNFHAQEGRTLLLYMTIKAKYLFGLTKDGLTDNFQLIGHFGKGFYLTDSVPKSINYTQFNEVSMVLVCFVKPGIVLNYPPNTKDPNKEVFKTLKADTARGNLYIADDYVVYEKERILPVYAFQISKT